MSVFGEVFGDVLDEVVFLAFDGRPGGAAQGAIRDAIGIDDDLCGRGFSGEELDVGGGGAQGAKEERGDFVVESGG